MKVYKLKKGNWKYKVPMKDGSYSSYDFQNYINRSRVKKALKARKQFIRKYKRPNAFILGLKLFAFYCLLVGLMVLLGKLGF